MKVTSLPKAVMPSRLNTVPVVLAVLLASHAMSDVAYFESEPNNKLEDYNQVSGAITLYGSMGPGDQDGFIWTVSDDDARKRWTFELHGIPEAKLTVVRVMQLEYADNGVDVTGNRTLFEMGTRDGTRPSIHEGMMFDPGEYVLGLAQSGSSIENGAYRFFIREESLTVTRNPAAGTSLEDAHAIRAGGSVVSYEADETAWYRIEFDESDAANRWAISVQVPVGRKLRASMHDADGMELVAGRVDSNGRFVFGDLAPPSGTWFLKLESNEPGMIQAIASEVTGAHVAGQEAEPNNEPRLANRIDFSQPLTGRIGDDDPEDMFQFEVKEPDSQALRTLRLESANPKNLSFCLTSYDWKTVQCRKGRPPLEMTDLLLAPGQWGIHIRRAQSQDYSITFEPQGPVDPGREVEPNDEVQYANGIPSRMRIKGRFSGDDTDLFQLIVTGEAQRWRFQANGDGIQSIRYLDGKGKQKASVKARKGTNRLRLDNVLLLPGKHFIGVRGTDSDYTLLTRSLGPPVAAEYVEAPADEDKRSEAQMNQRPVELEIAKKQPEPVKTASLWNPDGEVEPNDEHNMQRLAVGQTRTGTLPQIGDYDHYRFFVANHDHLKLTIEPPQDGSIAAKLHWYAIELGAFEPREPGEVIVLEGILPPGDYHLVLSTDKASEKPYRMKLERLPRFNCPKDCEPNGRQGLDFAAPLPRDLLLEGEVGEWRDDDVYQLPAFEFETELIVRSDDPSFGISLVDSNGKASSKQRYEVELGGYRIAIPEGDPHRLVISGSGKPYRLPLEFPGGQLMPVIGNLTAKMSLQLEASEVAAFLDAGQRFSGSLTIQNTGTQAISIELQTVSSDHRWSTRLEQEKVTIAAGEQSVIALSVIVPADAWADHPVQVSVRASDSDGRHVEAWSDVEVSRTARPLNAELFWPISPVLRGGFNAAWNPFGAIWTIDTPDDAKEPRLRDGLVFAGNSISCCGRDELEWTLDLPGEEPVPVAGFSFDAFGNQNVHRSIRKATLLLSQDGEHFSESLSVEALPVLTEQQFALPAPVPARFARLRVDGTFELPMKGVGIGEWKVNIQPGYDISGGQGFNLADPALGGHLAWVLPPDGGAARVLSEDDKSTWASLGKKTTMEYVVGFHRNRAAQIQRIEWLYHESAGESNRNFSTISVTASEHSPVGPWRSLGNMELKASNTSAKLNLETPAWARFIRFEAKIDPSATRAKEPGVIRVWERPGGEDYQSILTEWGEAGGRAFYEFQAGIPKAETLASDNDLRDKAMALKMGERTSGAVALGRQQNWYRVSVPPDVNTLGFELTGDPTVRTILALENASRKRILLSPVRSGRSPGTHRYEAIVEPDQEVWISISEPPRNVVFSWDTSSSVGDYIPIINSSITAFSSEVQPGQEWVNLLPFGNGFLLQDWSDDPLVLQTVLNESHQEGGSSKAEAALDLAARALAPRPGKKAVVLVTDARTPYFGEMWQPMSEIQPRVFGIGVGGVGIAEQNRFRDWAAVNGGDFRLLRYLGEMDVAFDRASTKMHRPATYTLLVEGELREAPGPGKLRVVAGESQSQAAVELILDASGSMLQRIDGRRRINVAKDVLIEAVREHIPVGTPLALRVFGHKEVDSCRTDLEIPLAPLKPDTAAKKIASISAMNLARTPIADSLASVEKDLGTVKTAAIVMVTDGEETCEGDPAAVIESLQAKGLDVSLNIVGFAIDNEELANRFESWAELGGGRYFSASNQGGLSDALESALRVPFTVYDEGGNEVATGEVGGAPVELGRGQYRVLVRTSPPQSFNQVTLQGDDSHTIQLE